jgi:polyisoprenoid-binding protein YceI
VAAAWQRLLAFWWRREIAKRGSDDDEHFGHQDEQRGRDAPVGCHPSRSTVEFKVKHVWGLRTVTGRFTRFGGTYTAVDDGATIELDIDAGSLDTGNRHRDRHLRGTDFFDVEQDPHVRFTSEHVRDLGNGKLWVDGELEAAGKRIPVSFEASRRDVGDDLELEATTTVDQRLLGMTYSALGTLRAPSTLHVRARLTPA